MANKTSVAQYSILSKIKLIKIVLVGLKLVTLAHWSWLQIDVPETPQRPSQHLYFCFSQLSLFKYCHISSTKDPIAHPYFS